MARQRNSILGIELTNREIKVIETRFANGKCTVLTAGSAAMPYGGMHEGLPLRIDMVATALRQLVDSLGASTRDAIIGLPSGAHICRPLSMPPVPDAELPVLVEGEVRHYMVLSTPNAPFGFFKVSGSMRETAQQVMLMGAEEGAISAYRELAHKAGLNIVAIEPAAIAMFRTASLTRNDEESSVLLAATDASVDLSICHHGNICLYRRIDVGFASLFTTVSSPPAGDLAPQFDLPANKPSAHEQESLIDRSIDTLVTEVRRSIEFYEREFPNSPPCDRIRLCGNDKRLSSLTVALSDALESEIEVITPIYDGSNPKADLVLGTQAAPTFTGVFGLSRYQRSAASTSPPAIDLFVHERKSVEVQVKRKGFAGALSVSIIAVLLGIYGGLHFGLLANDVEHELDHQTTYIASLSKEQKLSADLELKRKNDIETLSRDSAPLEAALAVVSNCIDSGTGVQELSLNGTGQLVLKGEASDSGSVIRTVRNMQLHQFALSATVTSLEKLNKLEGSSVKFEITCQVFGPNQAQTGGTGK